jgi:hypothetical protein
MEKIVYLFQMQQTADTAGLKIVCFVQSQAKEISYYFAIA